MKPDLVIFLDVDPVVAQTRGEFGAERYENLEMQKLVRSNYLKLQDETWRVGPVADIHLDYVLNLSKMCNPFQVVDANRTLEEVSKDVNRLIQETLDSITPESDFKPLWV